MHRTMFTDYSKLAHFLYSTLLTELHRQTPTWIIPEMQARLEVIQNQVAEWTGTVGLQV